ncbi:MAG: hypothetical protein ACT4UQ_06950 [Gammaproteobacteria bacterium]
MKARPGAASSPKLLAAALALVAGAVIAACERGAEAPARDSNPEMDWAHAALDRNPNLEVLAVDQDAGVFTLRDRRTGEVQTATMAELAAAPIAGLAAASTVMPVTNAVPAEVQPAADAPAPQAAADAGTGDAAPLGGGELDYTVERDANGIRVTGPGVSIVSAAAPDAMTARGEPGQQTADPVICEGRRMMQLDNRRIFVDGDAITARAGCELHITNSRIVASGTGVVARGATVHISNSYIEGKAGAYHAAPGAKIFLRGTTLNGVRRRDASAEVHELVGGEFIPRQ